jgi:hypothetical protein
MLEFHLGCKHLGLGRVGHPNRVKSVGKRECKRVGPIARQLNLHASKRVRASCVRARSVSIAVMGEIQRTQEKLRRLSKMTHG